MIKITRATVTPGLDDIRPEPKLGVELDIDGYWWYVGHLDPELYPDTKQGRAALMAFLEKQEEDMLRQAKLKAVEEQSPQVESRLDLMDVEFRPRDFGAEIDALKAGRL